MSENILRDPEKTDVNSEPEPWVGTRAIARFLSCSPKAVRDRAASGTIPCRRLGGRLRFKYSEVEQAMVEHIPSVRQAERFLKALDEAGL